MKTYKKLNKKRLTDRRRVRAAGQLFVYPSPTRDKSRVRRDTGVYIVQNKKGRGVVDGGRKEGTMRFGFITI